MTASATTSEARKGIGPKTAAEILGFFGGLDATYERNRRWQREQPQTGTACKPGRAKARALRQSGQLVRMRTDVPLDIAAVFQAASVDGHSGDFHGGRRDGE